MPAVLGNPCTQCSRGTIVPHLEQRIELLVGGPAVRRVLVYGYCNERSCSALLHVHGAGKALTVLAHDHVRQHGPVPEEASFCNHCQSSVVITEKDLQRRITFTFCYRCLRLLAKQE